MRLTVNQYAKALYESVQEKSQKEVDSVIGNFIKILQKNGQLKLAKKIVEKFSAIWNKENEIVEATVTSRESLDAETLQKIEKFVAEKYSAKEVVLQNVIDEKIKGGIIIKVGDEMMDASVAKRLADLRLSLTK